MPCFVKMFFGCLAGSELTDAMFIKMLLIISRVASKQMPCFIKNVFGCLAGSELTDAMFIKMLLIISRVASKQTPCLLKCFLAVSRGAS